MLTLEQIKDLAKKRGFSLRELASRTGYEYSGFYKALQRKSLKYEARIVLAESLGITLEELLEEHQSYETRSEKYKGPITVSNLLKSSNLFKSPEMSGNEESLVSFSKILNLESEERQESLLKEYKFLLGSLKDQLHSKDETIQIQRGIIDDLRKEIDELKKEE